MIDPGFDETEQELIELEKRIAEIYKEAQEDVQTKLDDYLRRFALKDKKWREWVQSGYKTQKEYQAWRTGQLIIGKRWEAMRDSLAADLHNANDIAKSIVRGELPIIYAINHDYATYEVESGSGIDTAYILYDRDTVVRLFGDDEIIPAPGQKVKEAIAAGKDIEWNKQMVHGQMLQAILQGEGLKAIADRVATFSTDSNRKAAIRNARTMVTGVQNAGRIESYKRAENMGIKLKQMWRATLDMRTRHEHRELDGQVRAVGEDFVVPSTSETIEYPGDPAAPGHLIYNCRCTLKAQVDGWESQSAKTRDMSKINGMTYDEWKKNQEEKSNPIELPEKLQEAVRQKYLNEYRYGGR